MIKTLQNTLKQDKEYFTVPKSVQDAIPIQPHLAGRRLPVREQCPPSRSYRSSRTSTYAIATKADKTAMLLDYSELLNALDTGATCQRSPSTTRRDRPPGSLSRNHPHPARRHDYAGRLPGRSTMTMLHSHAVTDAVSSVVQERYHHRVSAHKTRRRRSPHLLRARGASDVTSRLSGKLDSSQAEELDATSPLCSILRDFYQRGPARGLCRFDLRDSGQKRGQDLQGLVRVPDSLEFKNDRLCSWADDRWGRVLYPHRSMPAISRTIP